MISINFNEDWNWRKKGENEWQSTSLPHDAMIYEERVEGAESGINAGWYKCFDYEYKKTFFVPQEYAEKSVIFEFEGVYRNAEVFINGKLACFRPYGYTNFYVEANEFLHFGKQNEIVVFAKNADQPNSRWYSGAGIYRPVTMHLLPKKHILINGVKVRTKQINPAILEIKVQTSCEGEVEIEIERNQKNIEYRSKTINNCGNFTITMQDADLWSPQNPALYNLTARFEGDEVNVVFGIRKIELSSKKGFVLNGERVILRGACIHHDNGILGARCFAEAEERKIAILKQNGYNAIRSAHNPCSKALLNACDKLGVMVLDEYADMWYIHKTRFDYAEYLMDWYEKDLTDMINKDYNHPSVVMYSMGNEVAETGQKKGIELFSKMRDFCKSLDTDRPITCGVNIFFNWLHSMGFGVYTDKKAQTNPQKKVGSEFFNDLAGLTGAGFMKFMSTLYPCDLKTRDCYNQMDVAGYNYGILRYKHDLKKYPNRIILGSETFCSDAYAFYELAKNNPALIGDFVWAGIDYLGEVGIGSWEYKDYAKNFNKGLGWISAGSGRIDLIGNPLGEALYTKVAFEKENKPQIAVVPVCSTNKKHSPSAWKFSNAIPSWSWNGLNGKKARVEVYSRAPYVCLYINGKRVGKKKIKRNCRFIFNVKYYDGEITAVNLDINGNECERNTLITASEKTQLSVTAEKSTVKTGEICFVHLDFTDENGVLKPLQRGNVFVDVKGGELLALGNACPFNESGYNKTYTDTYYGRAMAVVKATKKQVIITAKSKQFFGETTINVED